MSNTLPSAVCDAAVILGVAATASAIELKVAYRKAIYHNHPSLNPLCDVDYFTARRHQACLAFGVLNAYRTKRSVRGLAVLLEQTTAELAARRIAQVFDTVDVPVVRPQLVGANA